MCYFYLSTTTKKICTCYAAQYLLLIQKINLILSLKGIHTNIIKVLMGLFPFKERKQQFISSITLLFYFNFCHTKYCTSHILTCTYVILTIKQTKNYATTSFSHSQTETWKASVAFGAVLFVSWRGEKGGFWGMNYTKYRKITVFPNFNLKYMTTTRIFPAHSSSQHYLTFHYLALAAAMTY